MIDKFQEFIKLNYRITLLYYQIEIAKEILEEIKEMEELAQCEW